MDLVVYNCNNRDEVIVAYNNCRIIPQKGDSILIDGKLYFSQTNPCFDYIKNTAWIFVNEAR